MSLDKQIKEMAGEQLNELCGKAEKALDKLCSGTPLSGADVGRLVSGHKTQTTYNACQKKLAETISKNMLASLATESA